MRPFHQGDGLPLDQVGGGHLGLDLGLIGAAAVQVKALHVAPLIVLQGISMRPSGSSRTAMPPTTSSWCTSSSSGTRSRRTASIPPF